MSHRVRPGDCFVVPLPNGQFGYVHYLVWNDRLGYLVRVLKQVSSFPFSSAGELQGVEEMFPPVFVGLRASVKSGRWRFIGKLPVPHFEFPQFRSTNATTPGTYAGDWELWDGSRRQFIGRLPPELRSLEVECVWGDELLEERIASGRNVVGDIR